MSLAINDELNFLSISLNGLDLYSKHCWQHQCFEYCWAGLAQHEDLLFFPHTATTAGCWRWVRSWKGRQLEKWIGAAQRDIPGYVTCSATNLRGSGFVGGSHGLETHGSLLSYWPSSFPHHSSCLYAFSSFQHLLNCLCFDPWGFFCFCSSYSLPSPVKSWRVSEQLGRAYLWPEWVHHTPVHYQNFTVLQQKKLISEAKNRKEITEI